LQEVAEIFV
jgi:hypothetical protein